MRLYVDARYHGDLTGLTKPQYVALVEQIAEGISATEGPNWSIDRVGTAPLRQVWP